jgi:flagellar biosynthesis protein FlhB
MLVGWSILLIIHGILAVFLLGAVTHQAIGVAWPAKKRGAGFFSAVRGVNGMSYTNSIVILFVMTFALGCIIYPIYRVNVRTVLQEYRFFKPEGAFEMKEHLLALSLALLPVYWFLWHRASEANRATRAALTTLIAAAVWWGFITGHVISNIRGFGS